MKGWKNIEVLVNDYKNALIEQNTAFSKKILTLLNTGIDVLTMELDEHSDKFVGGAIIDGEFYEHTTVISRINKLRNK